MFLFTVSCRLPFENGHEKPMLLRELGNLPMFNDFRILGIQFFQMALKRLKSDPSGVKKLFVSRTKKKLPGSCCVYDKFELKITLTKMLISSKLFI